MQWYEACFQLIYTVNYLTNFSTYKFLYAFLICPMCDPRNQE